MHIDTLLYTSFPGLVTIVIVYLRWSEIYIVNYLMFRSRVLSSWKASICLVLSHVIGITYALHNRHFVWG